MVKRCNACVAHHTRGSWCISFGTNPMGMSVMEPSLGIPAVVVGRAESANGLHSAVSEDKVWAAFISTTRTSKPSEA